MHSSDAEPVTSGRATGPMTPMRAFTRAAVECVLGGMFFGGSLGAVVAAVFAAWAAVDMGGEELWALAAGMAIGAAFYALFGCLVGIVLGIGYGVAVGVGTGAAMAAATMNRRTHLPTGLLRLVAALAAALSALIAITSFLLLNGGGRASLADEVPHIVTVLVVFVLAPAAIAGGFAAWRSPGWMPHVEDAAELQRR